MELWSLKKNPRGFRIAISESLHWQPGKRLTTADRRGMVE
jgi:hypothetical protein